MITEIAIDAARTVDAIHAIRIAQLPQQQRLAPAQSSYVHIVTSLCYLGDEKGAPIAQAPLLILFSFQKVILATVIHADFQLAPEDTHVHTVDLALILAAVLTLGVDEAIEPSPADKSLDRLRIAETSVLQRLAEGTRNQVHMVCRKGTITHKAVIDHG